MSREGRDRPADPGVAAKMLFNESQACGRRRIRDTTYTFHNKYSRACTASVRSTYRTSNEGKGRRTRRRRNSHDNDDDNGPHRPHNLQ